ncbi:virB8 family protein [Pseudoduganella chitinolytica]|uniref:VirB8 family protein n=1 Tax=Pseudoduganella chitinolytica TaxID=34070 RepID=A0ABY8B7S2_9BURK|nr:virB8 family protein [Pseudoduganella chitinolytica]WEF31463.1 virB8 family protein [Pseudoduganella chitinolytica]
MATKVEKNDFKKYLGEARSWETNRLLEAEKSKRLAWTVALVAGGLAIVAVVAVAGLTPLKQTELRIVRVDNSTGRVDVISEIPNARNTYGEALDKYWAGQYVLYREGYSRELAEDYYNKVGLMSGSGEQRRYADFFTPKNPQSPLNVYGANTRVKIHIKGQSFIKSNVLLVRYWKEIERGSSERPAVSHWAATIVFRYSGAPMAERDRDINPVGFQVTEYRNDPDAEPVRETPAAPVMSQAAPPPAEQAVVLPGVPPRAQAQVPAIAPANAAVQ